MIPLGSYSLPGAEPWRQGIVRKSTKMSHIQEIFRRLRSIHDPSVDYAMADALPTADPVAAKLIGLLLLERQHPDATIALVSYYEQLPPEVQAIVLQNTSRLYPALRKASARTATPGPANAIRIIQESKAGRLCYLVAEQLHNRPAELRAKAAACLLDLASWAFSPASAAGGPRVPRCDAVTAQYVCKSVEEAVAQYEGHEQLAVLEALAALRYEALPIVLKHLHLRESAACQTFRDLLAGAESLHVRRSLLVFLPVPVLMRSAVEGLVQAGRKHLLADVLTAWHCLVNPRAVQAVRRQGSSDPLWPTAMELTGWEPSSARGLARWITALPLEPLEQVRKLESLNRLPDVGSRLAALRELIGLHERHRRLAGVLPAVSTYCNDAHVAVARVALRHLIRCGWDGLPRLLARLVNCEHPELRDLASQHLAPMGFERLWRGWDRLDPQQRLSIGRALIKIDPRFASHLAEKLGSTRRGDLLRAMAIIQGLSQGALFETPLIALSRDPDVVIASAAVKALGSAHSAEAVAALEAALNHADTRVRANAVEALQQLRCTGHVGRLVEMARDEENRPRANAIQALLEVGMGQAITALESMLQDHRSAQRTSALWVVETMGLIDVARLVAEISITDPDAAVRTRATRIIRNMIDAMGVPTDEMIAI